METAPTDIRALGKGVDQRAHSSDYKDVTQKSGTPKGVANDKPMTRHRMDSPTQVLNPKGDCLNTKSTDRCFHTQHGWTEVSRNTLRPKGSVMLVSVKDETHRPQQKLKFSNFVHKASPS